MEFSNKKLQKAFEYFEKEKYKEALKLCNKVLDKDYNNEEALTLEGEILYKSGRIDDAIITWKINSEYNKNALAKRHLDSLDTNVREMALSYTSIYSENEEYRRLVIDAYKESTKNDVVKDENLADEIKASIMKEPEESTSIFATEAAKIKAEEEAAAKSKEEARIKAENEAKAIEDAKIKAENEAKVKEEARIKAETEAKAIEDAKIKAENEAKAIEDAKIKAENEAKATEDAKIKAENEAKAKEDAKIKAENEAKAIQDAKIKAENEAKATEDAKIKAENEAKEKPERIKVAQNTKITSTNSFNKKIVAVVVAAAIVIVGGIGIYKATSTSSKNETKVEVPKVDWSTFNTSIQTAIQNKNYGELYTLLSKAPANEVPAAEKTAYDQGLEVMKQDGVQYFYDQGMNFYNQKNYSSAIDSFNKGLKFADGTYLAPHLTYFIGASYSGLNDHTKAVEYYKLYLKNFPNDDIYNSGCLYVLAKYYYSQGDVKEAKGYAQELQNKYPNSPYNNTDISNIVNAK